MSTSEGIVQDVITPLVKRLDSVLRLPGKPAASSEVKSAVEEIKKQLESLKKEFKREKEIEKGVSSSFGIVWQHVDEMLEDPKVAPLHPERNAWLRMKLDQIRTYVIQIMEENTEKKSAPDTKTEANVTDASDSESNTCPSEAEKRIQESDAMSHLRLVIENLDTQLKHCLFCLTVFPGGTVIKKRLLIHWWIGENIVTTAEDGKHCFNELSLRGLVIPVRTEHCQTEHSCKVHPWIHKLLVSIATNNAFLEFDTDGTPSANYSRTHRAFLRKGRPLVGRSNQKNERENEAEEKEEDLEKMKKKKEEEEEEEEEEDEKEEDWALTLYNVDAKYVEFESSWFSGKNKLGTLQLGRWQNSDYHHIEISGRYFLEDLGACKNLKYLSLRGMSRVESLPDSIGGLSKLAVLDLRACHNLEKLTPKVSSLENLEYLDTSECYLLDQMPRGLKHLSKLEVLKGFVLGHDNDKEACRLSELASLAKLRKLSVSVGNESNEAELLNLTNDFKASLTSLTITWGILDSKSTQSTADEALSPAKTRPSNTKTPHVVNLTKLQKLDIRGFPRSSFPKWINHDNLQSLKKLYIRGGKLETFGQVKGWGVEVLRVRFLKHLSCDASTQETLFPNLKFAEIRSCPLLRSWQKLVKLNVTVKNDFNATTAASPTQVADGSAGLPDTKKGKGEED